MEWKLHLNLWQLSAMRVAISFWEKKAVQVKVAEFLKSNDALAIYELRTEWGKFSKALIKKQHKVLLPRGLDIELVHIIRMIGEQIFSWHNYIKHQYGAAQNKMKRLDEVRWTSYGTMDPAQIFESSWLENPNVNVTQVYDFASTHALKDCINDLWNKIPNDRYHHYNNVYARFDRHILAYWIASIDNDLYELMNYFQEVVNDSNAEYTIQFHLFYNPSCSIEENMLRLSVHQGFYLATKFFWEKLTESDKSRALLRCARIAVLCHSYYNYKEERTGDYQKSQYVEICIFFMNQMTDEHKRSFFNDSMRRDIGAGIHQHGLNVTDEILKMMLSAWPWQELFIPALKNILEHLTDHQKMKCKFLEYVTDKMVKDYHLGYAMETNKYRNLLHEAWLIIPGDIKKKIAAQGTLNIITNDLVTVQDLKTLKLILKDPSIATSKHNIVELLLKPFNQKIFGPQFEILHELLLTIFPSVTEKKNFIQETGIFHTIILKHYYFIADKLLDLFSSSPEERQSLKLSIDAIEPCKDFIIRYKYNAADTFLDWLFATEEQKKHLKEHFKNDIFSLKWICEIWEKNSHNTRKAKRESSQFLQWFLESKEEIVLFQKKLFFNIEIDQLTRLGLVNFIFKNFREDFFAWFLLSDEEIQQIFSTLEITME